MKYRFLKNKFAVIFGNVLIVTLKFRAVLGKMVANILFRFSKLIQSIFCNFALFVFTYHFTIEAVQRIHFNGNSRFCTDYCNVSALLGICLMSSEIYAVSKLTEVLLVSEITAFYKKLSHKYIRHAEWILWIFAEFRRENILHAIYTVPRKIDFLILLANYCFLFLPSMKVLFSRFFST